MFKKKDTIKLNKVSELYQSNEMKMDFKNAIHRLRDFLRPKENRFVS